MIKQQVDCGLNTKTCCALDELGYSQLGTALILTLTGGTAVLGARAWQAAASYSHCHAPNPSLG